MKAPPKISQEIQNRKHGLEKIFFAPSLTKGEDTIRREIKEQLLELAYEKGKIIKYTPQINNKKELLIKIQNLGDIRIMFDDFPVNNNDDAPGNKDGALMEIVYTPNISESRDGKGRSYEYTFELNPQEAEIITDRFDPELAINYHFANI